MDDLGPNKGRLHECAKLAAPDEVMVDLGVRDGVSSFTMLWASPFAKVIGVDPCQRRMPEHERYTYIQSDSISAASKIPDNLHLVFFDTLHIREQVMAELYVYWPKIKVGGWAVFHDTEWPPEKKDFYLGREWDQAVYGVRDFFAGAGDHIGMVHHPESWGMTFVQKLDGYTWPVEGILDALNASEILVRAGCGV